MDAHSDHTVVVPAGDSLSPIESVEVPTPATIGRPLTVQLTAWLPSPLLKVLALIVFLRYLLLPLVGVLVNATFPLARPADFTVLSEANLFWDIFARYDSGWYYSIARNGYFYDDKVPSSLAFFPLYPLLMGLLGRIFGGEQFHYFLAGMIISRVAFLGWGGDTAHKQFSEQTRDAGRKLGMQVQVLVINRAEELEGAFAEFAKHNAGAVVVQPLFANTLGLGTRIAELAVTHRLPTICDGAGFAEQGGLLYYGPDANAVYPRVAVYVDRILRGAKPGDLPVEQPRKFEFVINLKTARAIGAEPPRGLLLKVDRLVG